MASAKPPIPEQYRVSYLLGQNTKLRKGETTGWEAWGLEFLPAEKSGHQVCPWSTAGCRSVCLVDSGHGQGSAVKRARLRRTKWFFEQRESFLRRLAWETESRLRSTLKRNKRLAVRLNVFSDLWWENYPVMRGGTQYANMMRAFPEVQFFDYTKGIARALKQTRALQDLPNYHLTFSLAETPKSRSEALLALSRGVGVTAVFLKQDAQAILSAGSWSWDADFANYPVLSADENDLRFLDPPTTIMVLVAKGTAKQATGKKGIARATAKGLGFVQSNPRKGDKSGTGGCHGSAMRVPRQNPWPDFTQGAGCPARKGAAHAFWNGRCMNCGANRVWSRDGVEVVENPDEDEQYDRWRESQLPEETGFGFGLHWRRKGQTGTGTFKSVADALAWCDLYDCDYGLVNDGASTVAYYPQSYKRRTNPFYKRFAKDLKDRNRVCYHEGQAPVTDRSMRCTMCGATAEEIRAEGVEESVRRQRAARRAMEGPDPAEDWRERSWHGEEPED